MYARTCAATGDLRALVTATHTKKRNYISTQHARASGGVSRLQKTKKQKPAEHNRHGHVPRSRRLPTSPSNPLSCPPTVQILLPFRHLDYIRSLVYSKTGERTFVPLSAPSLHSLIILLPHFSCGRAGHRPSTGVLANKVPNNPG